MRSKTIQGIFILLVVIAVLFKVVICQSADVPLAWDANTEPDLAGYKIHYGTASENYTVTIDVNNVTEYTVTGLNEGTTYYFAATAYDTEDNESGYSVELVYTVPLNAFMGSSIAYIIQECIQPSVSGQAHGDGYEVFTQPDGSFVILHDHLNAGDTIRMRY
jgi:hypothetical protein